MRPTRLLVVMCLTACGSDPTLSVEVHHPTNLDVVTTTVTVYAGAVTCDDVRFGDLDATTLAGLQVAEETLDHGGVVSGSLGNLPRTDDKIIVARAFGADGKLAAGGCVEEGVVEGAATASITTERAALVSIVANTGTDRRDVYGVDVTVSDPQGNLIKDRAVSWRVYGSPGTKPAVAGPTIVGDASAAVWERASLTCTNDSGVANVHPVPPDLTGGYEVRARVAWTQAPVPSFSALTNLDIGPKAGTTGLKGASVIRRCALGRVEGMSPASVVGCIDGNQISLLDATVSGSGAETLDDRGSVALGSGATAVAVFGLPDATRPTDTDLLAVVDRVVGPTQIVKVFGNNAGGSCADCANLDDVLVVPSCDADQQAVLLAHLSPATGNDSIVRLDAAFRSTVSVPGIDGYTLRLNAAGCVTRLDTATGTPTHVQVVAVDFLPTADIVTGTSSGLPPLTKAFYDCTASVCSTLDLPVPGAGVGFSGGATPAMIATTIDASGVELDTFIMISAPQGNARADHLVSLAHVASVGIPDRIVAGNFDSDAQPDLAWNIALGKTKTLLQVGYAALGPEGIPLSAFGAPPIDITDLAVGDLTSDGRDDLVVTGTNSVTIVPTRVPALTGAIGVDVINTCSGN